MSDVRKRYDDLTHAMCVELGFCGSVRGGVPLHLDDLIPKDGTMNAELFIDLAFRAERILRIPRTVELEQELRNMFEKYFGNGSVELSSIRF